MASMLATGGRGKTKGTGCPAWMDRAAGVSTFLPSWQTVRDLILAALVAGAVAAVDYLTASIQTHPLGSAALTAAVVAALGILRRWLNPTVPVASVLAVKSLAIANGTAPLDMSTPPYGSPALADSVAAWDAMADASFAPSPDLDDDQFLSACATQIRAYTPGNSSAKTFDPATLAAILIWLFNHNDEIEAWIEQAKKWLAGILARWKLRSAIKAAMLAESDTWKPTTESIDGYAEWLGKADGSVIRRVRTIANARRK